MTRWIEFLAPVNVCTSPNLVVSSHSAAIRFLSLSLSLKTDDIYRLVLLYCYSLYVKYKKNGGGGNDTVGGV